MIIARSAGRAGNQLFVVSALLKLKSKREKLVLLSFDDFHSLLEPRSREIRRLRFPRALRLDWWLLTKRVLRTLAAFRITKMVQLSDGGDRLQFSRGLLPVALFVGQYCQDERLLEMERIRQFWRAKSEAESTWLASLKLTPETLGGSFSCFVHVRRGDYLETPSPEFPLALDADWYASQMDKVRKQSTTPVRFLMFSDDLDFCQVAFANRPDIVFVDAPSGLSFLAMSHCQAGILSASTFSWWAAKLAEASQPGPFIAPRYWFGWRSKEWSGSPTPEEGFVEWA
jgi:hypothetical protein